jgi:multidrug efflux pump
MENKTKKEFRLSSWAVDNKMTVLVIMAVITLGGLVSYITVPKESFPELVMPEVFINTFYPGNSPADMEKLITRPLEKELKGMSGVDKITSTSSQGYSGIDVKFLANVSPSEALRRVKDKVDIVKSDPDFPKDLPADPNVLEFNLSEMMPILNINLSGDYSLDDLEKYAKILEDKIEALPEITKVDIKGIMEKEMRIEADRYRMEARQVSFGDIVQAVQAENVNISGGELLLDETRRSVRVAGEFTGASDLEEIIIKAESGHIVYLRDVATVSFVEKEKESYARQSLKPVVSLDVVKRAGENLIEASAGIAAILDEARAEYLPRNLEITVTNDQSDMVKTQVDELQNSIIFGVLLVVGVLLFFLGLRNALFVGIAIPLSMFMSFMILSSMGVTFNIMVLFSLVLALGMLVDNGIVVVENIHRLMSEGLSRTDAAKQGVGEVAMPIIASTATTLAAFVPLAFWPGIMGEFMKYLPITLIIVLGSSLFVGLVINPMLTAALMKVKEDDVNKKKVLKVTMILIAIGLLFLVLGIPSETKGAIALGNLLIIGGLAGMLNTFYLTGATQRFQNGLLPRLEAAYERFLSMALRKRNPYFFFWGTVGLLFMSFMLLGLFPPPVSFFPDNQPQYLNVYIEKPIGTDIEITNEICMEIEAIVMEEINAAEYLETDPVSGEKRNFLVTSVIGQVGNGTSDPAAGPSFDNTPHKARITVSFVKFDERRGIDTNEVLNRLRKRFKGYPDAQVVVAKNADGPPQGPPINIELSGDDYDSLLHYAHEIRRFVDGLNIQGIEELKVDVSKDKPEMLIHIDRDRARRFGLSTGQIGDAIRTSLFGKEISTYKSGEDDYPVNVRYKNEDRHDISTLLNQMIIFRDQSTGRIKEVPVSAVANVEFGVAFSAIKRKDLKRVVTIYSDVLQGYNANEIVETIKEDLAFFDLPEDLKWTFTGQQEEQAKEMAFLSTALLIALFLILLIIVGQFNSVSSPFIIMFSVVFSLIGVFLGLVIFQMEFVIIMTMIGIISLAGVVVNNAIVLIDYTNLIRARMREERSIPEGGHLPFAQVVEAIIQGGKTRLRPVLLTAITTVMGLLPLAIGLNIDFVGFISSYDPNIYVGGDNNIFWKPMSWAIIFGLTFATFLTLIIVPVMYWFMARVKYSLIYREPIK